MRRPGKGRLSGSARGVFAQLAIRQIAHRGGKFPVAAMEVAQARRQQGPAAQDHTRVIVRQGAALEPIRLDIPMPFRGERPIDAQIGLPPRNGRIAQRIGDVAELHLIHVAAQAQGVAKLPLPFEFDAVARIAAEIGEAIRRQRLRRDHVIAHEAVDVHAQMEITRDAPAERQFDRVRAFRA